jgi:oligopeptide transport system substrate-binding protein
MPGKPAVVAAAVLLLPALLSAAGCRSGSDDGAAARRVVIGISEPKHLLPANTTEAAGNQVLSALFTPLVDIDANHTPVPVAATSIKPSAGNKVWTIALKPGLTFSNGEPVTAQNYIDAWNYGAYGPNEQSASYYFERIDGYADLQSNSPGGDDSTPPKAKELSGLKKIDDLTFTVTLSAPFAGWASVLSYAAFYPLPKAAFSAPGVLAGGFEDAIIGDGPFKLSGKWEHNAQIRVDKVAGFTGTAPKVDGITFKIYDDPQAEYRDLVAGRVDVQTQIPVERLEAAAGDLGDRLQKSPNSSYTFVGFPSYEKEFASVDVRRALSMAIDRKEMTDKIFLGSQTPATSFVSPVVAGYRPDSCGANCAYHPALAKQLYTAAHGPARIQISYNADGGHKAWVDDMCGQIAASLGISCVGVGEPTFADLLTKVDKRQPVGLIRLPWLMDYPLMEDYLSPLYGTNGTSNYYGYSNSTFDSLVKRGSEAATPAEAVKYWQQAEDLLVKDMPVIPLRFGENVYGHSTKVTGVEVDAYQRVDVDTIALVKP